MTVIDMHPQPILTIPRQLTAYDDESQVSASTWFPRDTRIAFVSEQGDGHAIAMAELTAVTTRSQQPRTQRVV